MDERLALVLSAVGTGVVLILSGWLMRHVAVRAAEGRLPRNQFAGIRTPATLASDDAWRAAHVAAEADTLRAAHGAIVGGAAIAVGTALAYPFGSENTMSVVLVALVTGSVAWLLAWTIRACAVGVRAARQVPRPGGNSPTPPSSRSRRG